VSVESLAAILHNGIITTLVL